MREINLASMGSVINLARIFTIIQAKISVAVK
jgi:hypothetical protein